MTDDVSFVRKDILPQQEPPVTERGALKWLRENLFPDVFNTILTLVALFLVVRIIGGAWPWFANGVWGTNSLAECREILNGATGACFSVLGERWNQLLFGFQYPTDQYWRLLVAFLLLPVAVAPLLFAMFLPARLLLLTALYPFVAFWLIWGGTILIPLFAMLGFGAAYFAFVECEKRWGTTAALGGALVALLVTWGIGGLLAGVMPGFAAFEAVPSRQLGGYMLNLILGTVCISLSVPFGILLALGRRSDMMIIQWICVIFIEFIRGVPLITLLFVANVVLAYFLPPGTNFDLILRVIIMITMFASAYIAEVIRGGLAALPKGQYEAADSLGLDYAQAMRLIIMPQALKISIPGIVNVAVGLFKDTTLVSVISMFDLVGMIRGPILAATEWNGVYWELWLFAILMFFPVCYGISQYSQWLERQLNTDLR